MADDLGQLRFHLILRPDRHSSPEFNLELSNRKYFRIISSKLRLCVAAAGSNGVGPIRRFCSLVPKVAVF